MWFHCKKESCVIRFGWFSGHICVAYDSSLSYPPQADCRLLTIQHWRLFPNHSSIKQLVPLYFQQHQVNQSMAMQFIQMGESWLITRCVLGDQFSLLTRRGCESILFFLLAAFGGSPVHTACPFFLFPLFPLCSSIDTRLYFRTTCSSQHSITFTWKQPLVQSQLQWVSRLLPPIFSLFPLCRYSRTHQCTTIYPIVEMANNWLTLNLVIAAQRRGRNGYGSRKRQRQVIPQPQPSQSTSEEESTDGGSVTRCVCGESRKCK